MYVIRSPEPGIERHSNRRILEGMDAGAAQSDYASLYHRAFAEYGIWALWNCREIEHPTPEEAMGITHSLGVEGDLKARRLAEMIEQACRAAV